MKTVVAIHNKLEVINDHLSKIYINKIEIPTAYHLPTKNPKFI